MRLQERRVDEFEVGRDARVVIKLGLPGRQQNRERDEGEYQKGSETNVRMSPIDAAQERASR